ncbi:hypothetical protein [Nonomuraea sp. NPDC049480]|uniref:hypothetical protein n=1 Tax=Nonomuraea sp. NPDC049480 TaxID=3364353 RepID=UPI0037B7F30A
MLGYTNNELTGEQRATAIGRIAELATLGRLGVAREVVPLDEIASAWHRQSTGTASGRLVMTPHPV